MLYMHSTFGYNINSISPLNFIHFISQKCSQNSLHFTQILSSGAKFLNFGAIISPYPTTTMACVHPRTCYSIQNILSMDSVSSI